MSKYETILIFSPQDWSHQFISKHHYAIAFSELNFKTYFVEPTTCKFGSFKVDRYAPIQENDNLFVLKILLPFPDWIRFKMPTFFKWINSLAVKYSLKKFQIQPQMIIDFGWHRLIRKWDFLERGSKIYFPVDDYVDLPIEKRACNSFFTVSKNIQEKFIQKSIAMKFVNHGLNDFFADKAVERLSELRNGKVANSKIGARFAYSGNLSIPFLDRELLIKLIDKYKEHEFHFFGTLEFHDEESKRWIQKLRSFKNVILHGQLSVKDLAENLFKMDIMLLCYKADNMNYHAENSHKLNEYLSTGSPLLSTPIKVLEELDLSYPLTFDDEKSMENSVRNALDELKEMNVLKRIERIEYALKFRYSNLAKEFLKEEL